MSTSSQNPDPNPTPEIREQMTKALSKAGAFCGECGFEPGDEGCPDCQRHHQRCVDELMPIVRAEHAEELAAVEQATRQRVADDFQKLGGKRDFLSWGEAHEIARDGLCRCQGGDKPCPKASAMKLQSILDPSDGGESR